MDKILTSDEFSNWDKKDALKSIGVDGVKTFVSGLEADEPIMIIYAVNV